MSDPSFPSDAELKELARMEREMNERLAERQRQEREAGSK